MKQLFLALLCLFLLVGIGAANERTWQTIQGGRITDGLTVQGMHLTPFENGQTLTVQFDGEPGWYRVEYYTHPFSIILSLFGVRNVTAVPPNNSPLIASISPLITLDDSMVRYYLELHRPVYLQARAQQDGLIITLEEAPYDAMSWDPRYSLRTQPLHGEALGHAEEDFAYLTTQPPRVVRSRDGWMVETGLYSSLGAAETAYEHLKTQGLALELVVEERNPSQRPQLTASRFAPWRLQTLAVDKDTTEYHIDAHIPFLQGLPGSAPTSQWNNALSEYQMQQIWELETDAKEQRQGIEADDVPFWPYVYTSRFHPTRNDQDWLSFTTSVYQYRGGAHGLTVMRGWNFHVPSGQQLQLSQLFAADSGYRKIIAGLIDQAIQENSEDYFQPYFTENQLSTNQDYYLTAHGLVVFFGLYELAPYAVGIPEFFIPYEQLPPMKVGDRNP